MLISSEDFRTRDIFIDYPFEGAKFRWDHTTSRVYRKFYGEPESQISHKSELWNQSIISGEEITREEYFED